MAGRAEPQELSIDLGDMTFAALAWGPADGPLALCLHGYPDTARTWRHLGPHLAEAGWRVVAPYMRGYAPTDLAPDGSYQLGALASDAERLHAELGGDERAVLIGHDWGAAAAYVVSSHAPEMFKRIVALAVAPPATLRLLSSPARLVGELPLVLRQTALNWYMFFQLVPVVSERTLRWLVPRLWSDWSPGYDAREDVAAALAALDGPGRATAALRYDRALFMPWTWDSRYEDEQSHAMRRPKAPLLYLHGDQDGCQRPEVGRLAEGVLRPPSRVELVEGAGHFLHLERPDEVNERISAFVGAASRGRAARGSSRQPSA